MKKKFKLISLTLAATLMGTSTLPNITTVYATENEQLVQKYDIDDILEPSELSLTVSQIDSLANEIQSKHQNVSKEWIIELIQRQL